MALNSKYSNFTKLCIWGIMFISLFSIVQANNSKEIREKINLKVNISKITTLSGFVWLKLSDEKNNIVDSAKIEVNKSQLTYNFKVPKQGNYAIWIFHDENSNGKLDKNFLGIPTEKYGFSNNPKLFFGPPKYEETLIWVNKNLEIDINI